MICSALREDGVTAPIDVHLMVAPVDDLIISFAKAGADMITFHPEASEHVDRSLQIIRDHGCKAGLAFNPGTPLNFLKHVMGKIDLVLIMSVNPGFGGQKFIPHSLEKIREARLLIDIGNHEGARLAIDGGVNLDNIKSIAEAGADMFIAGSAIFGTSDYKETIDSFRKELDRAVIPGP